MTIYAPTLTSLWLLIQYFELDPVTIFKSEGILLEELTDESRRLPFAVVDRLYDKAARMSDSSEFGLKAAEFWHPSHMGGLGYVWLLSPTLLDALLACARYIRMLNESLELRVDIGDDVVAIELFQLQESINPAMREDFNMSLFLRMCRTNFGAELDPLSVELRHSGAGDIAPYTQFLQCPVSFNAAKTLINFNRQQTEVVRINASKHLLQANLDIVHEYLNKFDGDSFRSLVSAEIIKHLPQGGVNRNYVANALHLSPKTLQRKLNSESTNFKDLLTQTRTELARQYMQDNDLSLTEISFLLGFAETSSFSRAYKRWTGVSPSTVHE